MNTQKTTPPKQDPKDPEEEKKRAEQRQRQVRFGIGYVITGLIAMWLFQQFIVGPLVVQAAEIPYSDFKQKLAAGQVLTVTIGNTDIVGQMKNPTPNATPALVPFDTAIVSGGDPKLVDDLQS